MARAPQRPRSRGAVDQLPSGAYRVRVYVATDPVTGARHDVVEVIPAGPKAAAEAEKVRTRLLNQLDERRNPRTKATVNQLLDRYLEVVDLDDSTRTTYVGYLDRHVRPVLGNQLLSRVDGEMLDSLYGQLRRCRARCNGRSRTIDHRTKVAHECDDRCHPHVCRPMAASSVRQIHWILSGVMERALRWRWIAVSRSARPSRPPRPGPTRRPHLPTMPCVCFARPGRIRPGVPRLGAPSVLRACPMAATREVHLRPPTPRLLG